MRYMGSAGDYKVERPGRLVTRAARLSHGLGWSFAGAIAITLVATAVRLLGPLVVRGGIDNGIALGDKSVIIKAAGIYVGLLVIQYFVTMVSQWTVAYVGERYLVQLREVVFGKLLRLDMRFFSRTKSGVLVSRMTSDIESLQEFASDGAVLALSNLLTVVGVTVALALVDWQMALSVFIVVGVLLGVTVVFQRQARRAYDQVRERIGIVLSSLQEGISGVRVVQAFTQEGDQATSFGRVNERHFEANMAAARAISWYFPVVAFLRIVAIVAALAIGASRVIDGSMTIGTLVAFLLYLDWFFQPIINLSNVYNLLQSALAALAKLFELLDEPVAVDERPGAFDLPDPVQGSVDLRDVDFSYLDGTPVLHDVRLSVGAGERVAIVGETGSGKSTLAKLVMRFYDPSRGSVSVDGVDLKDVTRESRVDTLALIPQDSFLFSGSLRENLVYAKPDATDEDVWRVLEEMRIDEWIANLPEGLDTEVRERGSRFSAGERQLVALARAFLADPAIIVLDEATSNLDPETEVKVEHALSALLTNRTSIVIAHRLRSAERADRVVVVDAGVIIAEGTHDELVDRVDQYRELVEVWQRGGLA
ncbi:MAG: ABC transporter ATP-binding protein/permease [Actinomycetia bacterium]|nr:ABC transporter ATP-binding protein/permease [Actinomycetes bacterium]